MIWKKLVIKTSRVRQGSCGKYDCHCFEINRELLLLKTSFLRRMSKTTDRLSVLAQAATIATTVAATASAQTPRPTVTTTTKNQETIPASAVGLLPAPKTIRIEFVPDWIQCDLKTPHLPVAVCVVLDKPGTLPQHSIFCFEFYAWVVPNPIIKEADGKEVVTGPIPKMGNDFNEENGENIPVDGRALLWYAPDRWPAYAQCTEMAGCRVSIEDLKCVSVVVRPHHEEKLAGSLMYLRRDPVKPFMPGLLRFVHKHRYFLNITFNTNSRMAQYVAIHKFRPIFYLCVKQPGTNVPIGSRLFTNFITEWSLVTEPAPSENEVTQCRKRIEEDLKDREIREKHITTLAASQQKPPTATAVASPPPVLVGAAYYEKQMEYARVIEQQHRDFQTAIQSAQKLGSSSLSSSDSKTVNLAKQSLQMALAPMGGNSGGGGGETTQQKKQPIHLLPIDVPYDRLVQMCKTTTDFHSIGLPKLAQIDQYQPAVPVSPYVHRYMGHDVPLASAMSITEAAARTYSLDPRNPVTDTAKQFLSSLAAFNQIIGWHQMAAYIEHPVYYTEYMKGLVSKQQQQQEPKGSGGGSGGGDTENKKPRTILPETKLDVFVTRAMDLLKKVLQRVDWVLGLMRTAGSNDGFDASLMMRVIAADRDWLHHANIFSQEAEKVITDMICHNQSAYDAFRKLQRNGVAWPHAPEFRTAVEAAGFDFRPMMIKRDRCVCSVCRVEISGWRPWHDPWRYHNYDLHDDSFKAKGRVMMLQPKTATATTTTSAGSGGYAANTLLPIVITSPSDSKQ